MTRPVAEILEQAKREGWPTSYIDAMANHHLCARSTERTPMAKLTPEELRQLQDAIDHKASNGEDVGVIKHLRDLGAAQADTDDRT